MKHDSRKNRRVKIVISAVVLLLLVCSAVFAIIAGMHRDAAAPSSSISEAPDYDTGDKWSEGLVTYDGEQYLYNNRIRTYLFMGIDTDEPVHKAEDGISGGQADALFLLAVDKAHNTLSVISIHRNTMTTVKMYDRDGSYTGDAELQICLQHGYGDGERLSCQRTAECVSNLFYGIPVHGYLALNMGGIGLLNDALGGVELTILDDIDSESLGVHLTSGETKRLSGDEAYAYCRSRDITEFDSASGRLKRQEQYLNALLPVMLTKIQSASSAAAVYKSAEEYIYSNIDYSRLADEITDMTYDESRGMHSIPGQVVMGDSYEEYHVEEDALYRLILDVFYDKVSEE